MTMAIAKPVCSSSCLNQDSQDLRIARIEAHQRNHEIKRITPEQAEGSDDDFAIVLA